MTPTINESLHRIRLQLGGAPVTARAVKAALAGEHLWLDYRDKSRFSRQADVSPGISVKELRGTRMVRGRLAAAGPKTATYQVKVYRGDDPRGRWDVVDAATLKAVVAVVNSRREAAAAAWERDL